MAHVGPALPQEACSREFPGRSECLRPLLFLFCTPRRCEAVVAGEKGRVAGREYRARPIYSSVAVMGGGGGSGSRGGRRVDGGSGGGSGDGGDDGGGLGPDPIGVRCVLEGDVDGNGEVTLSDLTVVLMNYGSGFHSGEDNWSRGDFDGDGRVYRSDFEDGFANWNGN